MTICSVIIGTGSYIPLRVISNEYFLDRPFYNRDGQKFPSTQEVVEKLAEISEIKKRRYVRNGQTLADIATAAARDTLTSSGIDPECLDAITVTQNGLKTPIPSIANEVRNMLGIQRERMACMDIVSGCPGWIDGLAEADRAIRAGDQETILVIGAEVLSTYLDRRDRDSMLFGDGAAAVAVQRFESPHKVGILSYVPNSDGNKGLFFWERSYDPTFKSGRKYLHMDGRGVYKYAIRNVPEVMKESIQKAGLKIGDIKMILMHQANGKMNREILGRLGKLYGVELSSDVMPMTIPWLGNTSTASIPTMLDLICRRDKMLERHTLNEGDNIMLVGIGAGTNIRSMVYRCHKTY